MKPRTASCTSTGPVPAADTRHEVVAARAVAVAASVVADLAEEAAEVDEAGFPSRSLALLHERGLLAAPLAASGPALLDPSCRLALLRVLAHVGRGSLPVGRLYEGHVNALELIAAFGSAAQVECAARAAAAGVLFGVWNTEAGDGVRIEPASAAPADARSAVASAVARQQLVGSKTFASGAGTVGCAVVTAADPPHGWQMTIVDFSRAAIGIDRSFWTPLGMRPSASFKVDLTGIAIGEDERLGVAGDYYREPMFSSGSVRFAAVQAGGVEAVFDATRAFLRAQRRSDDPYQRARLGEMAMRVAGARQWLAGAALNHPAPPLAGSSVEGGDAASRDASVAHAHLMRSAIEDIALRVMRLAERCVGARGLMRPQPLERLHRDLTHYLRQAAPDAAISHAGAHVLARGEAAHDLWNE